MEELIKIIKAERERQGLSYTQLAQKVGCTSRAISYWETGQRFMTMEMANKVLIALGISFVIGKTDVKEERKE